MNFVLMMIMTIDAWSIEGDDDVSCVDSRMTLDS